MSPLLVPILLVGLANAHPLLLSANSSTLRRVAFTDDDASDEMVPCAPKVMFAVDAATTNIHFNPVRQFLQRQLFSNSNFLEPRRRLGVSYYFAGEDYYKMIAVWGNYEKMEDVRKSLQEWKQEPGTHSALYNAILDLSKSWVEPDENGKVNFVIFTSSIDQKTIDDAKPYLAALRQRGYLSVVALGDIDPTNKLLPQLTKNYLRWTNVERELMSPNWHKSFWKKIYKCRGPSPLNKPDCNSAQQG